VDTTTAHGKLVFGMFALVAEYEAALIKDAPKPASSPPAPAAATVHVPRVGHRQVLSTTRQAPDQSPGHGRSPGSNGMPSTEASGAGSCRSRCSRSSAGIARLFRYRVTDPRTPLVGLLP